jgi:transcriptional regulator with XRE-family HTH domain
VTFQQIYKYERGINGISAGQLYELAQGSGTPIEYFFEGLETNERPLLPSQKLLLDVMISLGEIQDKEQRAAIGYLVRSLSPGIHPNAAIPARTKAGTDQGRAGKARSSR